MVKKEGTVSLTFADMCTPQLHNIALLSIFICHNIMQGGLPRLTTNGSHQRRPSGKQTASTQVQKEHPGDVTLGGIAHNKVTLSTVFFSIESL